MSKLFITCSLSEESEQVKPATVYLVGEVGLEELWDVDCEAEGEDRDDVDEETAVGAALQNLLAVVVRVPDRQVSK